MPEPIDLLARLPERLSPMELGKIVEPNAPFLGSDLDRFERWVLLRNYELKETPLSEDEMQALREDWKR